MLDLKSLKTRESFPSSIANIPTPLLRVYWISLELVILFLVTEGAGSPIGNEPANLEETTSNKAFQTDFCKKFCSEDCQLTVPVKCFSYNKACKCLGKKESPENNSDTEVHKKTQRYRNNNTVAYSAIAVFLWIGAMAINMSCRYRNQNDYNSRSIVRSSNSSRSRSNGDYGGYWNWEPYIRNHENGNNRNTIVATEPNQIITISGGVTNPAIFSITLDEGNGKSATERDLPPEYLPPPAYHECTGAKNNNTNAAKY